MKKIKLLPAREQIALEIKNAIMTGEFPAGTELIQEKIADMLGVSRMPVREAFLILERDRFINLENGRKAIVRDFSKDDIIEHYELRALLESEAARKAAENGSDATKLKEWQEAMLAAESETEFREYNRYFHEEIWAMSGGRRIQDLIESLWIHIPPVVMSVNTDEQKSHQEHDAILKAIEDHDGSEAAELMKKHILRAMKDYLKRKDTGK